jgi:hypothetical protein
MIWESLDYCAVTTSRADWLTAVLQMKVKLDHAREALRDERRTNKRLTNMLVAAVTEIEAARAQSDRLDDIAEGYSEALAQLIIPTGQRARHCYKQDASSSDLRRAT